MKTQLFIPALCLLLFAAIGLAQQATQPETPTQEELLLKQRMEELEPHVYKTACESEYRLQWGNQGADIALANMLCEPALRSAWGVADEQTQQMNAHLFAWVEHINETTSDPIKLRAIKGEDMFGMGLSMHITDTNVTVEEAQDITERLYVSGTNAMVDAMHSNLTPEQRQKMNESLLANIGEMPTMAPSMFEALDLTDAQREQMEQIKKALDPEFEKTLEICVNGELSLMAKLFEALKKDKNTPKSATDIEKELMAKDPEYKRIREKIQFTSQAFSTKFKTQMFDVLTDEQWFRLQELIDNPPKHALVFRKKLKEQAGENEKTEQAGGGWQPGPNSWKPGDAVPEEYRIERNTRSRFSEAVKKSLEKELKQ